MHVSSFLLFTAGCHASFRHLPLASSPMDHMVKLSTSLREKIGTFFMVTVCQIQRFLVSKHACSTIINHNQPLLTIVNQHSTWSTSTILKLSHPYTEYHHFVAAPNPTQESQKIADKLPKALLLLSRAMRSQVCQDPPWPKRIQFRWETRGIFRFLLKFCKPT